MSKSVPVPLHGFKHLGPSLTFEALCYKVEIQISLTIFCASVSAPVATCAI